MRGRTIDEQGWREVKFAEPENLCASGRAYRL